MRYGYWLPVFGGWLRNVEDERMEASWDYASRLARRSEQIGYDLTLVSDGQCLTGAYALGPEAGEWLQQATLAIRAGVPLPVLRDVIQPFPTFSEIYVTALKSLHSQITAASPPTGAASP